MTPIHELFARICRCFAPGDHFSFEVIDETGAAHGVPLHRVRRVWRNDELIWERPTGNLGGRGRI